MSKAAKPATKGAMFQTLAEKTGLTRKQVTEVFDAFQNFIQQELSKKGPGVVALPGLLKARVAQASAAVTAYVCRGASCSAPVTSREDFRRALSA